MSKIFLSSAESSSALYAQRLFQELQRQGVQFESFGIGSKEMENEGFERFGKAEEMAVVGIGEVLPKLKLLKNVMNRCVQEIVERRPDLIILMDYSGFNLRLAKRVRYLGIPIVYYVSPQIWAWKKFRLKLIKKFVDKMLVILPFEKEFYRKNGIDVEFVGHPLLDEISESLYDSEHTRLERAKYGIEPDEIVLGLMPGSRSGELKNHLGVQVRAAEILRDRVSNLRVAVLVAPNVDTEYVQKFVPQTDLPIMYIKKDPFDMVSITDCVFCASGTATLTVGLLEKPMLIMYRANPLTAAIGRRLIRLPNFGIVNLIMEKEFVPEFFQEEVTPNSLADEMYSILFSEHRKEEMIAEFQDLRRKLGEAGATKRVTQIVKGFLSEKTS